MSIVQILFGPPTDLKHLIFPETGHTPVEKMICPPNPFLLIGNTENRPPSFHSNEPVHLYLNYTKYFLDSVSKTQILLFGTTIENRLIAKVHDGYS